MFKQLLHTFIPQKEKISFGLDKQAREDQLKFSELRYRRLFETSQAERKKLEELSQSQAETKKALLNIMEDLEAAHALLELQKAKNEAILASIGDGVIATDKEGKIILMNRESEQIFGLSTEQVMGKLFNETWDILDEKGNLVPEAERPISIALRGKTTTTRSPTYYCMRKDKTKFPMEVTITPVIIDEKIIGTIGIFRDITKEKAIDKAKSEFVSFASHQLRTPLGIIKWYLEALENEDYFKKSPMVIRKYFDEIYKSNERVLSLVRDLLSVSRIEQKQVKNAPKTVELIPVIKETVEQMQIMSRKKKVTLRLTIQDQNIPPINIDILRFHEVIENLIANAIEYTMSAGFVEVIVKKIDRTVLISVKDTGIGISSTDQKKLFTKFFRSEKAIGHNPEGSGLGLYVVKSYVEGWGGNISVESSEGKGSTFTISLPILQKKNLPVSEKKGGDTDEENTAC